MECLHLMMAEVREGRLAVDASNIKPSAILAAVAFVQL